MTRILSVLEGASGKTSLMRLATLIIVVSVMLVWVKVSWVRNEITPMDAEIVALVLGTLGIKAAQRYGEKPLAVDETVAAPK